MARRRKNRENIPRHAEDSSDRSAYWAPGRRNPSERRYSNAKKTSWTWPQPQSGRRRSFAHGETDAFRKGGPAAELPRQNHGDDSGPRAGIAAAVIRQFGIAPYGRRVVNFRGGIDWCVRTARKCRRQFRRMRADALPICGGTRKVERRYRRRVNCAVTGQLENRS